MKEKQILNPFPGIRSFEPEEECIFFGRERQISEIMHLLFETQFVAVIGSSGCGKSSLVRAGVIPKLIKNKGIPVSNTLIVRPGNRPLENLSMALMDAFRARSLLLNDIRNSIDLFQHLKKGPDSLLRLFINNEELTKSPFLIFIDQFEEIFRFKQKNQTEQNHNTEEFIRLLLQSVSDKKIPLLFLISMRSDFIDQCNLYEGLTEKINQGHFLVPDLNEEDKKLAIRKPLEVFDTKISDGLVKRLLADLGKAPDRLPVLQHALMRTWEYWQKNKMTDAFMDIRHYEAIGGMQEALSLHGDEIFSEITGREDKITTEKIFKALTDLSSGNKGTRRPTSLSEIAALADVSIEKAKEIIDKFRAPGRTFLLPGYKTSLKEDSIIDISHESLMRIWKRLKLWVDEETASAQLYLRLANSARLYQEGKGALLINPELQLALKWQEENKPNAVWATRYDPAFDRVIQFLNYSKEEYERERNIKEQKQKKELRRARFFAVFLGFASLISLLFLIVSLNMRIQSQASEKKALEKEKQALEESKEAEKQRKQALLQSKIAEQQQEIAEQQKIITEEQKEFAVNQQNIALQQKQIALAEKQKAVQQEGVALKQKKIAEEQKEFALSQKQIAEKERLKAIHSEQNAQRLRKLAVARSVAIQASELSQTITDDLPSLLALHAFVLNKSNDGRENDPDIYKALLDVSPLDNQIRIHQDAVRKVLCSQDNQFLLSCADDGKVIMHDLKKGQNTILSLPPIKSTAFRSLALSNKNTYIASGTNEGNIFLWETGNIRKTPLVLSGHEQVVYGLVFSDDQKSLFSAGADATIRKWNSQTGLFSTFLYKGKARILSLSLYKNKLYFGDDQGFMRVIDVHDPSKDPELIYSCKTAIISSAISTDGKLLALGLGSGRILVINLESSEEQGLLGHSSGVTCLDFSPDNKNLLSSSYDGSIRIWDYQNTEYQPVIIEKHDGWVFCVHYDPEGKWLYSSSADRSIRKWPSEALQMAEELCQDINEDLTKEQWNKYFGTDIPKENACSVLK